MQCLDQCNELVGSFSTPDLFKWPSGYLSALMGLDKIMAVVSSPPTAGPWQQFICIITSAELAPPHKFNNCGLTRTLNLLVNKGRRFSKMVSTLLLFRVISKILLNPNHNWLIKCKNHLRMLGKEIVFLVLN